MKIRYFLFLFIILFKSHFLNAQIIDGKIKNINDFEIENSRVLFWNSSNKEDFLGYTFSNQNGEYSFDLKKGTNSVFIEVFALNYKNTYKLVNIDNTNKVRLVVNFIIEPQEIQLDEVTVKENKAIKVKNDTVFYNPKKFLNGSERKVEDLIKKLPGMSVNEKTGEIKYKGKSIETVKLEDDDLFGGNYSIGTKNISVDMVEQVQAIENYSENRLLKGIENSDKVAINLKLKKQKKDYSGSLSLSNGLSNKLLFNDDITLLGISKKIKSFGILSFNNIGSDSNNFSSISKDFNANEISENEFTSKKIISEPNQSSTLPNNRTKFNNSFFSNYNIIYKLLPKISIKNNLVYFYDNSDGFEIFRNIYFLNNGTSFKNSQINSYLKSANCFKVDLKLTYDLNEKSLLITDFSVFNQHLNSKLTTLQNDLIYYRNNLKTNDLLVKAKIQYTLKIGGNKALQVFSELTKNNIPQELIISPNNNLITGITANSSYQNSAFENEMIYNRATLLIGKNKFKQTFSLGLLSTNKPLMSSLNENDFYLDDFKNSMNYKKSNLFCEYISSFKLNKLKIQPSLSSNFYNQKLSYSSILLLKKSDLAFNSKLFISWNLNKHSSFFISGNIENKTPEEDFLFINKILENNNTIRKNIESLSLIKTQTVYLGYKYYDLFKQFGCNINLQYEKKQNTFLSNISVNPNYNLTTYFQNPVDINNKSLSFSFDKQIMYLKLYVKQISTFSVNNYKNAIDDFSVRNNVSKNYDGTTLLFSNFNIPINFENKLNFNVVKYQSGNTYSNKRTSINNTFKIVVKPIENWIFILSHDFFITNTKTNNDFSFIDFDVKYQSTKLKWLSFNFVSKNLLNINTFSQTNSSDYSTSTYTTNIIPRYFLIATNLNF